MSRVACFLALWPAAIAIALAADERTCTMRDAALPASNQTVVLCEQGLLLVTTDDGATWATRRIAQSGGFRAIAFIDASHGLAVGDTGQIYSTDDTGRAWQKRDSGTDANLTDIQMVGSEGWIA